MNRVTMGLVGNASPEGKQMGFAVTILVGIVAVLALVAIRSPRQWGTKAVSAIIGALAISTAYAGLNEMRGTPKPVSMEWWLTSTTDATVLASHVVENKAIYLWLQVDGTDEPRAYEIPWDKKRAQELIDALNEAQARGSGVRMHLPFEKSLDTREMKFYALPQPALPPKENLPDAPLYVQPGQNA